MTDLIQLLDLYNVPGGRYTYFPFHGKWDNSITKSDWIKSIQEKKPEKVDLYIHIPFCHSLCTFCGCNIKVMKSKCDNEIYTQAIKREWKQYAIDTLIDTLYIGGGTPNFFNPQELQELIENFNFTDSPLITIEIDPRFISKNDLIAYKEMGINRLSFGVQDFDDKVLANINRHQNTQEIIELINFAHTLNFNSINIDLIYGLAFQTDETFSKTVEQLKLLNITSISLYPFAKVPWQNNSQNAFGEMKDFTIEEMNIIQARLSHAFISLGFEYFGMGYFSNNKSILKRNIMGFNTRTNTILIGLGVSAISSSPMGHLQNEKIYGQYLQSTKESNPHIFKSHLKTMNEDLRQTFFNNVICNNLIKFEDIELFKLQNTEAFLENFLKLDLIEKSENGFKLKSKARFFHKTILQNFDPNFIAKQY